MQYAPYAHNFLKQFGPEKHYGILTRQTTEICPRSIEKTKDTNHQSRQKFAVTDDLCLERSAITITAMGSITVDEL
jgi:hypothetical protein